MWQTPYARARAFSYVLLRDVSVSGTQSRIVLNRLLVAGSAALAHACTLCPWPRIVHALAFNGPTQVSRVLHTLHTAHRTPPPRAAPRPAPPRAAAPYEAGPRPLAGLRTCVRQEHGMLFAEDMGCRAAHTAPGGATPRRPACAARVARCGGPSSRGWCWCGYQVHVVQRNVQPHPHGRAEED